MCLYIQWAFCELFISCVFFRFNLCECWVKASLNECMRWMKGGEQNRELIHILLSSLHMCGAAMMNIVITRDNESDNYSLELLVFWLF